MENTYPTKCPNCEGDGGFCSNCNPVRFTQEDVERLRALAVNSPNHRRVEFYNWVWSLHDRVAATLPPASVTAPTPRAPSPETAP